MTNIFTYIYKTNPSVFVIFNLHGKQKPTKGSDPEIHVNDIEQSDSLDFELWLVLLKLKHESWGEIFLCVEGKVLMWLTRCRFELWPDGDGAPGAFKCASWPLKLSALCRAWQVAHASAASGGCWLMQMVTAASPSKTLVFLNVI